jgi:hypothetical protein
MTVTLEIAQKQVDPEEDVYVLSDHVFLLKQMSPAQIREAVGELMRKASRTLAEADCLATWAADKFPGEQFSRIIRCVRVGPPVKDPVHPLCIERERERQAMTTSLKDPSDG